jgi:hypothetical protein
MNSYPGLVRVSDHVVYEVAGRQRYGIVRHVRHDDGQSEFTSAAVQPAAGGPLVWFDIDL